MSCKENPRISSSSHRDFSNLAHKGDTSGNIHFMDYGWVPTSGTQSGGKWPATQHRNLLSCFCCGRPRLSRCLGDILSMRQFTRSWPHLVKNIDSSNKAIIWARPTSSCKLGSMVYLLQLQIAPWLGAFPLSLTWEGKRFEMFFKGYQKETEAILAVALCKEVLPPSSDSFRFVQRRTSPGGPGDMGFIADICTPTSKFTNFTNIIHLHI